jgi:hypothetical protein
MINKSGIQLLGPIISDHLSREWQIKETRKIIDEVDRLHENAVIVAGSKLPQIFAALDGEIQYKNLEESFFAKYNDGFYHEYVYLIPSVDSYKQFIEQSRSVYFLDGMDTFNMDVYQIDLKQLGAQKLYTGFEIRKASIFENIK